MESFNLGVWGVGGTFGLFRMKHLMIIGGQIHIPKGFPF